jgi:hypothetical protein
MNKKMIKLKNLLSENEESDKRFADYIYKSYLEDAKQDYTAAGIAYTIQMDTDSRINPRYIKSVIKQHYGIDLK